MARDVERKEDEMEKDDEMQDEGRWGEKDGEVGRR